MLTYLPKKYGIRHWHVTPVVLFVCWDRGSVVVVRSDVAAFSNNEELWGEIYIGMKLMIMGT
eukprot:scaffold11287_cov59-Cyclotella_meneghiniana.AAC.6